MTGGKFQPMRTGLKNFNLPSQGLPAEICLPAPLGETCGSGALLIQAFRALALLFLFSCPLSLSVILVIYKTFHWVPSLCPAMC